MILPITGIEHLHRHSCFSLLDGYAHPEEYAEYSSKVNQKFLCITDHGMMACIPRQIKACEDHNIFPIFGCELYLNPMQPDTSKEDYETFMKALSEDEKKYLRKSFHILAVAHNEIGYSNLVRLSSWGWTHGLGGRPRRPRVTHEQLIKYKEGITFTSGCYNSEIGQAFEGFCGPGGDEAGFAVIEKYMAMFGRNFYLELMLLDFSKQKPYDAFLIRAHERYGVPLVLTNDCHYCYKDDARMQRIMLQIQTKKTNAEIEDAIRRNPDIDFFELQDTNLWMKSEEEVNSMWMQNYSDVIPVDLFNQSKANTVRICEKAKGVQLDRNIKLPQIPDADQKFKECIFRGIEDRGISKSNKQYMSRLQEEYNLICKLGFSSYFLIQKQMVDEARRVAPEILGYGDGSEAVGPGRGSAVGALSCYCLGITDVDPIKHDLLFSRFLSESRGNKKMKLRFTNIDPVAEAA